MRIIQCVDVGFALLDLVERWHGQVEMAVLDQLRHLLVEEGYQQAGNMCPIDVGVGHDDHLLVAQLVLSIRRIGAAAEGLDEVADQRVGG